MESLSRTDTPPSVAPFPGSASAVPPRAYPWPIAWLNRVGEDIQLHAATIAQVSVAVGAPAHLVTLVVLVEDKRFWIHPGVDPIALLRAAYMAAKSHGLRQGGSSIAEQLLKLNRPRKHQTIVSRLGRAFSALRLTAQLGREEILVQYLQTVYFGRNAFGVHAAAAAYFRKATVDLSPAEAFFLAERIALPARFRARRIENILRRPVVHTILGTAMADLPAVYAGCFNDESVGRTLYRTLLEFM